MAEKALNVQNLRKSYRNKEVVKGVNFSAHFGEITAVLGPNGAGKTTTIECCEGLRIPDSGTIEILGHHPHTAPADIRSRWGVMLQDGGLPMAVPAGVVLTHVTRLASTEVKKRRETLISQLQLQEFLKTPVRRLSGGQRQRLALACALAGKPSMLFLDEPTAGMDVHARRDVHDIITSVREQGTAIVLTTHLLDEAEALADRVVLMSNGSVAIDAKTSELSEFSDGRLDVSLSQDITKEALLSHLPHVPHTVSVEPVPSPADSQASHSRWRISPVLKPDEFAYFAAQLAYHDVSISKLTTASDLTDLFLQIADSDTANLK